MSLELINKIYEQIKNFKPIDNTGKELYGENFTSQLLIEEKLDKLPKEVFLNPNLKWLDPCSGIGNYPISVIRRLMISLEDWEKDENKRLNHIMKNMIYMVEIQERSFDIIKDFFKDYEINLYNTDFIELNFNFKFDLIIGNPPYEKINLNGTRAAKNSNLWSKFIEKSFNILEDNGFLLFITPPSWMSPSSKELKNIFSKYKVFHIDIENCSKYFKVGSKFSYFLVKKEVTNEKFLTDISYKFKGNKNIKSEEGFSSVNLKDILFIPQLPNINVFSILEKTLFNKNIKKYNINYDSDLHRFTKKELLSDNKDDVFKYETIHTPAQTVWSSRPHKNYGKIKVFISLTSYYEKIIISNAGNTQGMGYIICENEKDADFIRNILLTDFFIFIANITRWSNFNVPEVMKLFPEIPINYNITNLNDYVNKYLNLSKEEVVYIEKMKK